MYCLARSIYANSEICPKNKCMIPSTILLPTIYNLPRISKTYYFINLFQFLGHLFEGTSSNKSKTYSLVNLLQKLRHLFEIISSNKFKTYCLVNLFQIVSHLFEFILSTKFKTYSFTNLLQCLGHIPLMNILQTLGYLFFYEFSSKLKLLVLL